MEPTTGFQGSEGDHIEIKNKKGHEMKADWEAKPMSCLGKCPVPTCGIGIYGGNGLRTAT
jgi:hypothetical protein